MTKRKVEEMSRRQKRRIHEQRIIIRYWCTPPEHGEDLLQKYTIVRLRRKQCRRNVLVLSEHRKQIVCENGMCHTTFVQTNTIRRTDALYVA